MDRLAILLRSPTRARLLEVLFSSPGRIWRPAHLARATGQDPEATRQQIRRLTAAGVLIETLLDGHRDYRVDLQDPATRDLARYVQQTRGLIPDVRAVLRSLRVPIIAWTVAASRQRIGPAAPRASGAHVARMNGHIFPSVNAPLGRYLELVVLTSAPKALVTVQLSGHLSEQCALTVLTIGEWLKALETGDAFLRNCRRARKLWVLGSWDDLIRREHAELELRDTRRAVLTNWREELSDEWDEDWDPSAAAPIVLPLRRSSATSS